MTDSSSTRETDVLIIGAGPCGLFQVFELGLLDIRCEVVDSLEVAGGQCAELYPDKPIYDIPAWPIIGAQELVEKLLEQIKPFNAPLHLGHEIQTIERLDENRFRCVSQRGTQWVCKAIVVAGGVGSFQPKKLRSPGADDLEQHIRYKVRNPDQYAGKRIAVLGGGDSALDWVNVFAPIAQHVTLIHRRNEYRAQPASVGKMREFVEAGKVTELPGMVTRVLGESGELSGIEVQDAAREKSVVPVDELFVFWGLSPKLGPIAEWGLNLERNQIHVDTEKFETSEAGIYAVGDINTYPGKKKLILSGFHEAALAAFAIKARLEPDKKVHLQYTTTSTAMHERLGVK